MEIEIKENLITLSGFLNERTDLTPFVVALEKAAAARASGRVIIDFSSVVTGNSIGLLNYAKCLKSHQMPITYRAVPAWLVEQFGLIKELMAADVMIESVFANFYCPQADLSTTALLHLGTDVPILTDYSSFRPTFVKDGNTYEPDFDSEAFFLFITANIDLFRRQFRV